MVSYRGRKVKKLFIILAGAILGCGCWSCHSSSVEPIPPIEADNPSITMEVSGGFFGIYRRMSIDPAGLASDETVYPVLHLQLNRETRDSLLVLLKDFEKYDDSYPSRGADIFQVKITLKTRTKEKSVEMDQIALEENPGLGRLSTLAQKLFEIESRVFQETCPWLGLQYTFSLDKPSYRPGEIITIACRVTNPTSLPRTLYFRNKYRLQFGFASVSNNPQVAAWIPDHATARNDSSPGAEISFSPGESKDIRVEFNQHFIYSGDEVYMALPVGSYGGTIYLLAGSDINGALWGTQNIAFQIVR